MSSRDAPRSDAGPPRYHGLATRAVHAGEPRPPILGAVAMPIFQSSTFLSDDDRAYVIALMAPVTEPGKIMGWIARPARGINGQPFDYDYVRLA